MALQTLIPNEVWQLDDFFAESICHQVLEKVREAEVKVLDASKTHLVSSGYYNYNLHSWGLRNAPEYLNLRRLIFAQLNELLIPLSGTAVDGSECNPIQLFAKSFNSSSHYELHTEPPRLFGGFAFVIYLQDEVEGALRFVTRDETELVLQSPLHSRKAWTENVKFLEADGQEVRYIGPLRLLPKKNSCVVFRTGSAHYVEPISVRNAEEALVRPCLAGWPHAFGFEKHLQPQSAQ